MALTFVSTIGFSLMHATIRPVSAELHPFEIAFFRNLFGLMTRALKEAEATIVLSLDVFKRVWAAILGYWLFGEMPDRYTWIGGIMIFMSATYTKCR